MKHIYAVVFSVLFVILTGFICKYCVELKTFDDIEDGILFEIKQDGMTEQIEPWKNNNDKYFVFMPSYAEPENVVLKLKGNKSIFLDDIEFFDGDSIEGVELSKEYMLGFENSNKKYPIQFLQSANVATMYIDTSTGKMDRVYRDKNNKERASVTLFTTDGKLDYAGGRYGDSIKCRGNSTFGNDKKPFLINLDKPQDLLGMGSARKWVLLANAYDPTNLRNKLVLDFAKKTKLKWTPDCEYVDLYLNGEYNGLYLLCEKVEVGENRLNIDSNYGFLFTLAQPSKIHPGDVTFTTNKNRAIIIIYPPNCTFKNISILAEKINQVESMITQENDSNNDLFEYIDLESWITRYLIDEIFLNIDGDQDSSYFYIDRSNKIYAGPVWDYDLCLGSYFDEKMQPNHILERDWYSKLNDNCIFMDAAKQLYSEKFAELFERIEKNEIDTLKKSTYRAMSSNNIRWGISDDKYEKEIEYIKTFVRDRKSFLEEYWFSDKYYNIDSKRYIEVDIKSDLTESTVDIAGLNAQIYERLVYYMEIAILGIFLILLAVLAFVSVKNRQRGCDR